MNNKTQKKPLLDTNIIIRFLTNDEPEQAVMVEKLLKQAKSNSFELPDLVVMEIVYVLLSFYKLSKVSVVEKMSLLLDFEAFELNEKLLIKTLGIFSKNSISFVDAYLCAKVKLGHNSRVYSFDKKLLKVAGEGGRELE